MCIRRGGLYECGANIYVNVVWWFDSERVRIFVVQVNEEANGFLIMLRISVNGNVKRRKQKLILKISTLVWVIMYCGILV